VAASAKYDGVTFSVAEQKIIYRKAKVTPDRPGAFLAIWQRPPLATTTNNKPIAFAAEQLDYLFVLVTSHVNESFSEMNSGSDNKALFNSAQRGMFIFPVALLLEKGIVASSKSKGKTGFRVFPPWSQNRGVDGTKVFSASGKKTQRWQLPYFVAIDEKGLLATDKLPQLFTGKVSET
jgi:hypothetical protein